MADRIINVHTGRPAPRRAKAYEWHGIAKDWTPPMWWFASDEAWLELGWPS